MPYFVNIWFVLTKLIKKIKLTTLLQQIYNQNQQNKPSIKQQTNKPSQPSINQNIPQLCYFSSATFIFLEVSFFFFIKCEYFCNRFTGGIVKYRLEQIVKHNKKRKKRDGKKKNRFISRFPYFAANHGWIWISRTDLWHLYA